MKSADSETLNARHLKIHGDLLARNTVLNLIGQALPLLVAVVTMPFVVSGLGTERFGILALAWVVLGYFSIFDLGLGRAATKFVAEALGKGENERIPAILWTAVTVQAAFGVLGALVLAGITPILVERILNIPSDLVVEARLSSYFLAFSVPIVLVTGSLRGTLEAAQRFDLVNAARVPFSAANFLLPLIGVLLRWGLPKIVALLLLSRGLALITHHWLCISIFESLKGLPRFHRAEFRALIGFGGWVTVSSIVGPILVYLDRSMIGILLTMAAVTYYTVPYEMITRLWLIPASLVTTLFPAFSTLSGQDQRERLETLVSRSVKYLLLALGLIVVIIVAYAHDILQLWLGADFARESTLALQILAIGVLIQSLASVPYWLVQALGRPDLPAKFHLIELPLHVLLVWAFIGYWGIAGAALAWALRVVIDALLLFIAAGHLSTLPPRALLDNKVPQTALLLAFLGLVLVSINVLMAATWIRFVTLASALLFTGISVWHFLLDGRDRTQVVNLLRMVGVK